MGHNTRGVWSCYQQSSFQRFLRASERLSFRYSQRLTATDVLRDMWVPDTATDAVRLRYGASARGRRWDVAAGALTITEAGGQVTDLEMGPRLQEPREQRQTAPRDARDDREGVAGGR